MNSKLRFRPAVLNMTGYVPGEQPKLKKLIKLNTNENAYPPSPKVAEALRNFDYANLRRYPDPVGQVLREEIAKIYGVTPDMVILANGSDDLLTIVTRCFTDEKNPAACVYPTYSLYPTLAEIQHADCIQVPLNPDFSFPEDFEKKAEGASIAFITRPNAPTGFLYPKERIDRLCRDFNGAVLLDETYVDFAADNCLDLLKKHTNLIISRTFSKSRSLAGLRFGFAIADPEIITQMMKVKDSYNVSMLSQILALASLQDMEYTRTIAEKLKAERKRFSEALLKLNFRVVPSETNFVFVSPPAKNAEDYFRFLRTKGIIVRYFPGGMTGEFVRITIGLPEEMDELLEATREFLKG